MYKCRLQIRDPVENEGGADSEKKIWQSGFPVSRPLLGLHPWNGTSLSKHMLWMSLALGTRLDFFSLPETD